MRILLLLISFVTVLISGCDYDPEIVRLEARASCRSEFHSNENAQTICLSCVQHGLRVAAQLTRNGIPFHFLEQWRQYTSLSNVKGLSPWQEHACQFGMDALEFEFIRQSPHLEPTQP